MFLKRFGIGTTLLEHDPTRLLLTSIYVSCKVYIHKHITHQDGLHDPESLIVGGRVLHERGTDLPTAWLKTIQACSARQWNLTAWGFAHLWIVVLHKLSFPWSCFIMCAGCGFWHGSAWSISAIGRTIHRLSSLDPHWTRKQVQCMCKEMTMLSMWWWLEPLQLHI